MSSLRSVCLRSIVYEAFCLQLPIRNLIFSLKFPFLSWAHRYLVDPNASTTAQARALLANEWECIRQAMGVLDAVKYVTTSIQGGGGGLLAQATFLMRELREVLQMDDHEIYPKVTVFVVNFD